VLDVLDVLGPDAPCAVTHLSLPWNIKAP
jgi:hypothetical protein